MHRLFIYDGFVLNVDTDQAADRLLADPKTVRELTPKEITDVFGNYPQWAGPDTTSVDEKGNITFTFDSTADREGLKGSIKSKRDVKLKDSDWRYIQGNEKYRSDAWDAYRQALREITTQPGFPESISWPAEPK